MITAPILETERIRLRPIQTSDFDRLENFMASDGSCYVGGPMSRGDCWRMFASDVGQWVLLGFGAWAIEHRESGDYMGQIGLNHPAIFPSVNLAGCCGRNLKAMDMLWKLPCVPANLSTGSWIGKPW